MLNISLHKEGSAQAFSPEQIAAFVELRRNFDAEAINLLANHEDIRPHVGGEGYLDLSEVVARPENWFLKGEHGGFLLTWSAPEVHEVHTMILRSGRGKWAGDAARAMVRFATDAGDRMLWTRIHPKQRNVAAFARTHGMIPTGGFIETFGEPYAVSKMDLH